MSFAEIFRNRVDMYTEYLNELKEISGKKIEEDESIPDVVCYFSVEPFVQWIDIRKKGETIGFLIVSQKPQCHNKADWFICQAYLKKEFRYQGIMQQVVKGFMKDHPGKYCLLILKKNHHAKEFWNKLFSEQRYISVDMSDNDLADDDTDFYFYEPEKSTPDF